MYARAIRTVALDWTPSGLGIRNSTASRRTAFDRRVAALKGLKKVAGGSATAVPPDSRPPHGPNPGRGSRGNGTTPCSSSRPPHQAAKGRPYNRFSTCWSKGHRPAASTVDRHLTPQRAQTTATRTSNLLTHRHSAERAQNQPRGSAGLLVYSPLSLLYSLGPWPPDLCVRSAGLASKDKRAVGPPREWDRTETRSLLHRGWKEATPCRKSRRQWWPDVFGMMVRVDPTDSRPSGTRPGFTNGWPRSPINADRARTPSAAHKGHCNPSATWSVQCLARPRSGRNRPESAHRVGSTKTSLCQAGSGSSCSSVFPSERSVRNRGPPSHRRS